MPTSHAQDPASPPEVASLRRNYAQAGLAEDDLADGWLTQFERWLADAVAAADTGQLAEPNAMVLGTVSADGVPSARTVLLKGYDEDGLVFYSNHRSRKGVELLAAGRASLLFPWIALERQVIVLGRVEVVADALSDEYFASRPRGSQLGAWASPQSSVVEGRAALESSLAEVTARFDGGPVRRPPWWGGFRVVPDSVEFWQGRPSRMHDRLVFVRSGGGATSGGSDGGWRVERRAP